MNTMYKVYQIDICFTEWETYNVYVGAKSIADIQEHLETIFPPNEIKVTRETWMDKDDWDEATQFGKYKEGDVYLEPFFAPEEYDEFMKENQDRIKETNLYTDSLYKIVHSEVHFD